MTIVILRLQYIFFLATEIIKICHQRFQMFAIFKFEKIYYANFPNIALALFYDVNAC